jgi:hypothetical protein
MLVYTSVAKRRQHECSPKTLWPKQCLHVLRTGQWLTARDTENAIRRFAARMAMASLISAIDVKTGQGDQGRTVHTNGVLGGRRMESISAGGQATKQCCCRNVGDRVTREYQETCIAVIGGHGINAVWCQVIEPTQQHKVWKWVS